MTDAERTLGQCAYQYAKARGHADRARDELMQAVRKATAAGMSESEAARLSGVTRMTIRKWVGK